MDLDIAIKYYSNLADDCRRKASPERYDYMDLKDLAAEHEQLADWLNELKILREKVRTLLEKDKWIQVSERLPEEETDVLICNVNGDIAISRGSMSTESTGSWIWYTSGWRFGKVTAWRPLPEPYKEEEK